MLGIISATSAHVTDRRAFWYIFANFFFFAIRLAWLALMARTYGSPYGSHLWLALMARTYGSHLWLALMARTYGSHLWLALMARTYGSHLWLALMARTYGSHLWLACLAGSLARAVSLLSLHRAHLAIFADRRYRGIKSPGVSRLLGRPF